MNYFKGKNGSYLHNNLIISRPDERNSLFVCIEDDVICCLNGYAVIPIETYYELKEGGLPRHHKITKSVLEARAELTIRERSKMMSVKDDDELAQGEDDDEDYENSGDVGNGV